MEGEQSALFQKDHELAEHIAHEWTSPRRSKRAKTQITPKKSEISSLEEEANAIYSLDIADKTKLLVSKVEGDVKIKIQEYYTRKNKDELLPKKSVALLDKNAWDQIVSNISQINDAIANAV